jgi:hypothetical protein
MASGMTLLSGSLLLFATLDESSTFWNILPGLLVGGLGMAITMAPTTTAAMSSVPVDKAGVGSAVLNSMRQVGGSMGIAIMGAIVAASVSAGPGRPDPQGFLNGFHHALETAAGLTVLGAVIAALTLPKAPKGEEEHEAAFSEAA